jgi:hypothetical protein
MFNTDTANPSQTLTHEMALKALPEGAAFSDFYRRLRLTKWSEKDNDYIFERTMYQDRSLDPNWTMRVGLHIYTIGQVSGSSMSTVYYERQE